MATTTMMQHCSNCGSYDDYQDGRHTFVFEGPFHLGAEPRKLSIPGPDDKNCRACGTKDALIATNSDDIWNMFGDDDD